MYYTLILILASSLLFIFKKFSLEKKLQNPNHHSKTGEKLKAGAVAGYCAK